MISSIFRAGLLIGAASGAVYLARKYYGSDFDQAVDKAKSVAKDIGKDVSRNDEAVSASLRNHI
jgi:hypothetical protein